MDKHVSQATHFCALLSGHPTLTTQIKPLPTHVTCQLAYPDFGQEFFANSTHCPTCKTLCSDICPCSKSYASQCHSGTLYPSKQSRDIPVPRGPPPANV